MTKDPEEGPAITRSEQQRLGENALIGADHYGLGRIHSASGDATETILRIRTAQRTIAKRTRTAIS